MKPSTLILLLLCLMIAPALIWLLPVIYPVLFGWLVTGWQIVLSLLVILPVVTLLAIRYWRRKKKFHFETVNEEEEIARQDAQQRKQKLNGDWQQLWSKLEQRIQGNPYAVPWLMMLGTDGSGKTGWLIDAGFERINGSASNQRAGIVFWLGESAVVVELAGHYYTREKELLAEDLWQYLLTLLRKKRPRRPLTGILAALSTNQLVTRQASGLLELARQLRWRLMELNRQFGMQIPVWFLLTQADRLNGFSEFFHSCNQQKQVMPWGFFLPEGYRRDHFQQAFEQNHRELSSALLDCIQHEKDRNARQAQMRYILQFRLLGERLRFFCEEIFQSHHGLPSPELKGIWFNSCGQYGDSTNLLASELARQHGFTVLPEQPQTQDSQSYFTQQFFNRVIFNDLGGVRENLSARRIWQTKYTLSYVAMLLVLSGGLGLFGSQINYNEQLLSQQARITREFRAANLQSEPRNSIADAVAPLAKLRELNQRYQQSSHWHHHLGLLDWTVTERVREAYQNQLRRWLVIPLAGKLRYNLNQSMTEHSNTLFDDLQYYLMLFKPELRDAEAFEAHVDYILDQQHPLEYKQQKALGSLLKDSWEIDHLRIQPDQHLIEQATSSLAGQVDEKIIYEHIRSLPQYSGNLSMKELFGNEFDTYFSLQRKEQEKEGATGFPVIFTRSQYKSLDLSATSPLLYREMANLNRIRKGTASVSPIEMSRISKQVRQLYFADYIRAWNDLLTRIELKQAHGIVRISRQITTLFKGDSALLYRFMNTVAAETRLADPPKQDPANLVRDAAQITQSSKLAQTSLKIRRGSRLLDNQNITPDNPLAVNMAFTNYEHYVSEHSANLNDATDVLLQELESIYHQQNHGQILYSTAISIVSNEKNILLDLWEQAAVDNTVAGKWLTSMVNNFWNSTIHLAGQYCQERWQLEVYSFWDKYLDGRFPMSEQATSDVQVNDFIEFFKPGGRLDKFTTEILSPFLNDTRTGWQLKTLRGTDLGLNRKTLNQLNKVKALQNSLFNADGSLQISYRIRAKELTPKATEFSIRDSNGRFLYRHGPQLWQERKWPTLETEQLTLSMMNSSQRLWQKNYTGSWAWLKFIFDSQHWQNGDRIELSYSESGYGVQLEVALDRRSNPFDQQLYRQIQLPEKILR